MNDPNQDTHLVWEVIETREASAHHLLSVRVNTCRSPRTGKTHEFQVLDSPDWVAVIPVTADDEIVMVKQFRHGTRELSLEPPGGLIKDGQSPEQSCREELEEETGYLAGDMELLGWMYPMPALFTNRFYVFAARGVTPTGRLNPDETEAVETVLIPCSRIADLIADGVINNSVMISALHLFLSKGSARLVSK